ncbi:hypothetical protein [Microbacterium sp.]|nr:hypothetical protein [Microbacterium sp.]
MNRRLPAVSLASAALLSLLAGCAPQPEIAPTSTPTPTAAADPSPSPEPVATEPTEEPAPEDPTCETLLAPSTLAMFDEHGWTYREQEFRFGEDVVDGGFQCVWGDYSVASDHVQVFGWAPLDASASVAAQQKLLSQGWLRADQDGHTYITEDPSFAFAVDEDGYGMTYEFGDGWATLADTRQGLVLIQLP